MGGFSRMWYEVLIGGVVGLITYVYLHYLNKNRERRQLEESVAEQAEQNARDTNTDKETMNWLNFIIKQWYIHVEENMQAKVQEIVQPILDDLDLPSPISGVELETVSFGQNPPRIDYVRSRKDVWEQDPHLQALSIILQPVIDSPELKVKLHVKGIGHVVMEGLKFEGELKVVLLKDNELPFPCIKWVYVTFEERPEISNFNISWGAMGMDVIPSITNYITDMIEEILSDTLVDPGRFFIDMSTPQIKPILIQGVRKLKRTVLHLQVEISKNLTQGKEEKRSIKCVLNSGGNDSKSKIEFYRNKKTHHIWYPLAVLQEDIKVKIYNDRSFGKDESLVDAVIAVNDLTGGRTREINRSVHANLNLLTVVKATAYDLPYIPIRQTKTEVVDYSEYFKLQVLTRPDILKCPSGLVYLHIHRATDLSAKDTRTHSSDPYVKVLVEGDDLFKTKTVKQNLNPIFNHFEDFFVNNVIQTSIKLQVFDYDATSTDDFMGEVKLPLTDVVPQIINGVFEIRKKDGGEGGKLYISVIFRPVSFAPTSEDVSQSLCNNLGTITILD